MPEAAALQPSGETRSRPFGITVIAVGLFAYAAFLSMVLALALLQPEAFQKAAPNRTSEIAWELAYVTPFRIGLSIVLGIGIWFLRRWAQRGLLFFAGLSILGRASVFVLPNPSATGAHLTYPQEAEIAFCILVMGYLVSPKISLAFEVGPQSDD